MASISAVNNSIYTSTAFKAAAKTSVDTGSISTDWVSDGDLKTLPSNVQKGLKSLEDTFTGGDGGAGVYRADVNFNGTAYPVLVAQASNDTGIGWRAYSPKGVFVTNETTSEV